MLKDGIELGERAPAENHVEGRFIGADFAFAGLEQFLGICLSLVLVNRAVFIPVGSDHRHKDPLEMSACLTLDVFLEVTPKLDLVVFVDGLNLLVATGAQDFNQRLFVSANALHGLAEVDGVKAGAAKNGLDDTLFERA